jgi:hypothetical protein
LVFRADDVQRVLIGGAVIGGILDVVGAEGARLLAGMGDIAFFYDFHIDSPDARKL